MRIMCEIAIKDGDNLEKILQYAGYLIKIANMGQRFAWSSVLKYDLEYRTSQANSDFLWGADSSYLMQVFLREDHNRQNSNQHRNESSYPQTKYDPSSGKPVCNRFNSPNGCRMRNCRFMHVCKLCFSKDHSGLLHRNQNTTSESIPKNGL